MNQIEKIIDIATWNRREHFKHFSAFDDPFFGVTVHVDCRFIYFLLSFTCVLPNGGTSTFIVCNVVSKWIYPPGVYR